MIFIYAAFAALFALAAWEASRWAWDRKVGRQQRRARSHRQVAKQKAWDVVFGSRRQRRLGYRPETPEDEG